MTKKQAVSDDMKKVKQLLKEIPENKQPMAQGLYNELVFMQQTLTELKTKVQEEGAVSLFKQGQQEFLREHPALTAYNKTIQRYNQTYKQLLDLFPETDTKQQSDPLIDFIKG